MTSGFSTNYQFEARKLTRAWSTEEGTLEVLHGIDLAIQRGEYLSVRGPSGSGKSTLLRLLGALDSQYGGDVLIDGRSLGAMSDRERSRLRAEKLAFVFQSFMLLNHLTVLENLLVPSLWTPDTRPSTRELENRALALLDMVGLRQKAKSFPDTLSGGQQQRVAIARALMTRPDAILCDEPTGALDSANSANVLQILENARKEFGMTLIVVTHDQEVMARANRYIEMSDGRIVSDSAIAGGAQ